MDVLGRLIVEHRVRLKVCELCGRIYCRSAESGPYCIACEAELREFPAIGSRKVRGRPRQKNVEFLVKPQQEAPQ